MILFGVFGKDKKDRKLRDWHSFNTVDITAVLSMNAAVIVKALMTKSYPELDVIIEPLKIERFDESNIKRVKLRNVDYYSNLQLSVYPLKANNIIQKVL